MEVVVERAGKRGSYKVIAHRSESARGMIARAGGKKLLPTQPQQQPAGVAVAMSPSFGLLRQFRRSG